MQSMKTGQRILPILEKSAQVAHSTPPTPQERKRKKEKERKTL